MAKDDQSSGKRKKPKKPSLLKRMGMALGLASAITVGGDAKSKVVNTDTSSAAASQHVDITPGESKKITLDRIEPETTQKAESKTPEDSDMVQTVAPLPQTSQGNEVEDEPEEPNKESSSPEKPSEAQPAAAEAPTAAKSGSDMMQQPQPLGGSGSSSGQADNGSAQKDGDEKEGDEEKKDGDEEGDEEKKDGDEEGDEEKKDGDEEGDEEKKDGDEEGDEEKKDGEKNDEQSDSSKKDDTESTPDAKPEGTTPQQNIDKPGGSPTGANTSTAAEGESAATGAASKGAAGSLNEAKAISDAAEKVTQETEKKVGKTGAEVVTVIIFIFFIVMGFFTGVFFLAALFYGFKHRKVLLKDMALIVSFAAVFGILFYTFLIAIGLLAIDQSVCSKKAVYFRTAVIGTAYGFSPVLGE